MPVMFIMRGISGSGKTTAALAIAKNLRSYQIVSADSYFVDPVTGVYDFRPEELQDAHQKCLDDARRVCECLVDVIVDNTNTQKWEYQKYVNCARVYGYTVVLVEPTTPWARDPYECAQRTVHGVPLETIKRQLERME